MAQKIDLKPILQLQQDYRKRYGSGYLNSLLKQVFHFSHPDQVRLLTCPKWYHQTNTDVIAIKRVLESIESMVGSVPVYYYCYLCGKKISEDTVPIGTTHNFYLCSSCNGNIDLQSEEDAKQIHTEIRKSQEVP